MYIYHKLELLIIELFELGQFWNTDVAIEQVTLADKDRIVQNKDQYKVMILEHDGTIKRKFKGLLYPQTWSNLNKNCIYAGDSQGGRSYGAPLNETVIEGNYLQYIVDGLFECNYTFGRFEAPACLY